jgi:adenylate cyclase
VTGKFDYTRNANRFASSFPILNYLLIQIFFWILSYCFLAVVSHLLLLTAGTALTGEVKLSASIFIALFFGFFTGLISGIVDLFLERRLLYNKALGVVIVVKAVIFLFLFVILISFVRYSIYPFVLERFFNQRDVITLETSWDYFFYFLLIYSIATNILISFINQINRKFGPGVLIPLLLGRYRKPREEERIFLFMDLRASTSIAEKLGHLKYSAFIRDSFMDINLLLPAYNAQVYQYVGDEIVITWPVSEGLKKLNCLKFFFGCKKRFSDRTRHYQSKYNEIPAFKAGLHMGKVTAVEVGNIKRDIAYHGDTLNTASRIQGVCNEYNQELLVSVELLKHLKVIDSYAIIPIGAVTLRGRNQPIEIAGITKPTD